ncbi:MAG: phage protease [Thermodesulfovibrionales bacterium]|nr:phage protease [Thermodesulfovibrionales bacterium]
METRICSHRTEVDGAPGLIQLIPHGRHNTDKGSFTLDAEGLRMLMEAFSSRKNQMAIDYEHQSLTGAEAPAAGWIVSLKDMGEKGLWAEVSWTERARRYLCSREYRFLSPVFLKEAVSGRVVRLLGAGLTNHPAIDGMVPVVNSEGFPPPDHKLNHKPKTKEVKQMEVLFKALGLGADATASEAVEAVEALKAQKSKCEAALARTASKEVLEAMGLDEGASASEVMGTVMALKRGHEMADVLAGQVKELGEKLRSTEAHDLVAQAMREGKITPAQEGWARDFAEGDPEGFSTFIAKAPTVLNFGQGQHAGISVRAAGGLDETQRKVNSLVGVSEEIFRKHNN